MGSYFFFYKLFLISQFISIDCPKPTYSPFADSGDISNIEPSPTTILATKKLLFFLIKSP
jgi:hypothetical protein